VLQCRCVVFLLICVLANLEVRDERRFGLGLTRSRWPVTIGTELLFKSGEAALHTCNALLGSLAPPAEGFLVVFGNAPAKVVHIAESGLRLGITLLGKRPDPLQLRFVVNGLASSKDQKG
jgi:hypothetical protein